MKHWKVVALVALVCGMLCGCEGGFMSSPRNGKPSWTWLDADVRRIHDDSMQVTCWMRYGTGLTCIPDWQLKPVVSQ